MPRSPTLRLGYRGTDPAVGGQARRQPAGGLALPCRSEELVVLELTEVQSDIAGDTQFPFWDRAQFDEVSRVPQPPEGGLAFDFVTYRRKH